MMTSGPGTLILLNGASSAGKTTLCKAIREQAPAPFLHFSLDFFMFDADVLPKQKDPERGTTWKQMRPNVINGFYLSMAALLTAGNNLVVDVIIEEEDQKEQLLQILSNFDVFFVGVHCSLQELEKREKARGDRHLGGAALDFKTVHSFLPYDFEVNSEKAVNFNAQSILTAWENRKSPSVFKNKL